MGVSLSFTQKTGGDTLLFVLRDGEPMGNGLRGLEVFLDSVLQDNESLRLATLKVGENLPI